MLQYLHEASHRLCKDVFGDYLPVRGNIGIFCHDYDEFKFLTRLRKKLTHDEPNYNGKYYPLKQPITFPEKDGLPAAKYDYLYIRQVDPYRSQVGDVDFAMTPDGFNRYMQSLAVDTFSNGARVFGRPEENMIELWLPTVDVLCYIADNSILEAILGKRVDIAGVVVRNEKGEYLLVQEARADVRGKWNLPAGRVDDGETPEQAALREAREETGYEIELHSEKPVIERYVKEARRTFHIYEARTVGGELHVKPTEALDVAWLSYKKITQLHASGDMRADIMYEAISLVESKNQ